MVSKRRGLLTPKTFLDLAVLSLMYACYWWIRHHRFPPFDDWAEAIAIWSALYLVQAGYRRVIGELEQQNALLVKVVKRLEEEGPR